MTSGRRYLVDGGAGGAGCRHHHAAQGRRLGHAVHVGQQGDARVAEDHGHYLSHTQNIRRSVHVRALRFQGRCGGYSACAQSYVQKCMIMDIGIGRSKKY